MVSLHKFYPITGCLFIAALTSVVWAASALSLIPEIDAVGEYSRVTEFPVRAGDPGALSALAPEASRRITGRVADYGPLTFQLDLDRADWQPGPAYLVIKVDRVSAGGAAFEVRVDGAVYGVRWETPGTWVVGQNFLLPLPLDAEICVIDPGEGVIVVDAYAFYRSAADLPEVPLIPMGEGETLSYDAASPPDPRPPLSEAELQAVRLEPGSPEFYRRPYSTSPHAQGMALEDIWPSHWLTVAQADTAGEVIHAQRTAAPWAESYFQSLLAEAEELLQDSPQVPIERVGWRHDYYSPDTAGHLVYDPSSPDAHLDPISGRFYSSTALRQAWVLLTHERTYKLMRSMGLLYAATGDERYAAWVAEGMRAAAAFVETAEASGWERSAFGGTAVWYQPLYDATALLALANAYALTRDSAAYDAAAHERIRTSIFEARIPRQMHFLQNIGGLQNMAAYAAAAVAVAGELYQREDWLAFGVGPEYGFVRWLEANVPDGPDGRPDGWWNEQTTFYHFYALAPLITLYNLSTGELSEANAARFRAMFEAPLELVQPDLNFHLMGDLAAPGNFSIVDVRSFYEFAAGVLSSERFGPVLARIYAEAGLERGCLWALFYGPPELPQPGSLHRGHGLLPVSGFGVFRDPAGELELGFRGGPFRGGHDHPDRLSIFLADAEGGIAADLGEPGYGLRSQTEDYFRRTISHNTLFADETDNRGSAVVDWRFDAVPARARGVIANADGVRYERTVYFDPPFVVVSDLYQASTERRFGWAFHASGNLELLSHQADAATAASPPLGMPPIPTVGNGYKMVTEREATEVSGSLRARWKLDEARQLEALIASDGPFEATTARSAGNPFPADRGALLLRAPGMERRFVTVLERHDGESQIEQIEFLGEKRIRLRLKDGSEREYGWSEDAAESFAEWAERVHGDGTLNPQASALKGSCPRRLKPPLWAGYALPQALYHFQ